MARKGQRRARGRPEAGMNEEASAGEEDVQNRSTIFRKGLADHQTKQDDYASKSAHTHGRTTAS